MTNDVFVDDKKIKDILTYISGMKHAEQIRMMFLCSLNGMRSINFAYLQVKDVFTDNFKIKDVICLDYDKNKGKNKCSYYMNNQLKKEFCEYLKYLQRKWKDRLTPETYLFTSQKLNKPYNRLGNITPDYCYNSFKKTLSTIENICKKFPDKKIVVITHHAPSIRSVPEIYKNSETAPLFCKQFRRFYTKQSKY